jgi:hypothetical protein
MANPAGESNAEVLRLDFDRRLMLQFRGWASPPTPARRYPLCEARRLAISTRGNMRHR